MISVIPLYTCFCLVLPFAVVVFTCHGSFKLVTGAPRAPESSLQNDPTWPPEKPGKVQYGGVVTCSQVEFWLVCDSNQHEPQTPQTGAKQEKQKRKGPDYRRETRQLIRQHFKMRLKDVQQLELPPSADMHVHLRQDKVTPMIPTPSAAVSFCDMCHVRLHEDRLGPGIYSLWSW